MRAKIARTFGGHPFKDEYTKLDDMQLLILYRYILEEEKNKKKESRALIKDVLEATFKQFKFYFDEVQLFINAKLFKRKLDFEEQMKNDKISPPDVTVDNFEKVWKDLEAILPMEVELNFDEEYISPELVQDPEFDKMLAGWLDKK